MASTQTIARQPDVPASLREAVQVYLADAEARADPFAMFDELRAIAPVFEAAPGVVMVTGHPEAAALMRDPRVSRWEAAKDELQADDVDDPELREALNANRLMMINRDAPDHTRLRNLVRAIFLPSLIASWSARVDETCTRLIDAVIDKPEFDLSAELAYPLPEIVICEMLGVPHADHDLWSEWSRASVAANRTPRPTGENLERVRNATLSFHQYFRDLLTERRRNLGDDIASLLLRAEEDGQKLSEDEIIATLELLIQAGHETTANLIGLGMHNMLLRPDRWAQLVADPSKAAGAVEELLRFEGPAQFNMPRKAIADIEIGGTTIKAGTSMIFALLGINRDARAFGEPNSIEIDRSNVREHLAFGFGSHTCIGRNLATLEANAMFRDIARRLPNLELAETPTYAPLFTRGLTSLKVRNRDITG